MTTVSTPLHDDHGRSSPKRRHQRQAEAMKEPCRFIVLDTPRARVAKIASILKLNESHHADILDKQQPPPPPHRFAVEFLPCVATFDSYTDEQQAGGSIRYLASVDYYGPDVSLKKPQSLLPFFDQVEEAQSDDDAKGDKNKNLCGICGVVVGMGIEGDEEDLARIKAFIKTLSPTKNIPVESVQPTPPYATIKEELAAFRALDTEAKEEVTRLQSMGPGRMAKFVTTFANKVIAQSLLEEKGQEHKEADCKIDLEAADEKEEKAVDSSSLEGNSDVVATAAAARVINPNKIRYSCRTCRTILFGHDDLEDPPHVPSRHHFSRRKATHGLGLSSSSSSSCESYFLQTSLVWMDEIDGQNEGKFACYHCGTKLGTYNWSGAQCSCGTWVVPAIQIPKSRVDAILPINQQQSLGTAPVITPLILQPTVTSANAAAPGQVVCD